MLGQVIDDFYDSWPFCWFWHTHAAIQCGCVDFFRMQNAKSGISKVSVCRALKIFSIGVNFTRFQKVQQFQQSNSLKVPRPTPKGFGKVKTSIVFLCEILLNHFFRCAFFFPENFNSLHWMPVRPRNPGVGVLCGEGFWHLRKCCEVLNTSFLCDIRNGKYLARS